MTATFPPLPLPFPISSMQSEGGRGRLPVASLPVPGEESPGGRVPFSLPVLDLQPPASSPPPAAPPPPRMPEPSNHPPAPRKTEPLPAMTAVTADFTDADLTAALLPLVGGAVSGLSLHDDAAFEAILRATFRRALSEHQHGPFQQPDWHHRTLWRMQALFSSRSYEEVLADKIRRFHVEEVYLLDRDRLSLVSYASSDPVRHANARNVGSFARQLALRLRDESGALQLGFELGESRRTFVRAGKFCYMVAVIRGEINDLMKADLDFALKRIETRYRSPFVQGHPLLKELQPLLEECLLIHSPAPPSGT
ncbi:hypothetical protein [Luteolibacter sp. Populi]|uniref:hypothetical protein n=1 Tax=Luteolibacter sp. Populi TaxID=3230487 RepID=UPI0034661B73